MSEYVAVSNGTFEIAVTPTVLGSPTVATPNQGVHNPGFPAYFGINDCKKVEDNNCKVQGDKFLVDSLREKIPGVPPTGGTALDFNCGPTGGASAWVLGGTYVVLPTSIAVKCSGIKVMRDNDSTVINCSCQGSNNVSPTPQTFAGSCSIKISNAGQTKVKAE